MTNDAQRFLRLAQLGLRKKGHDLGGEGLDLDEKPRGALDTELRALDAELKTKSPDWAKSWPAERKAVAFVQALCREYGIPAGPVDGLTGAKTRKGASALETLLGPPAENAPEMKHDVRQRLLRLAKLGLGEKGHDLGAEHLDLNLKTCRALEAELGALGREVKVEGGWWEKDWKHAWSAERKVAAYVQWMCFERHIAAGRVDSWAGKATKQGALILEPVMTLPEMMLFAQRVLRADFGRERSFIEEWRKGGAYDLAQLLDGVPKTSDALEEAARKEWLPKNWNVREQLVGFIQLLCRQAGFKAVGEVDGGLGWRTLSAFDSLSRRHRRGPKIGLALSGGGFRSAIFHLGVIRRLEELGIFSKVSVISSVSGGSIVAAYYLIEMERRLRARRPDPAETVREAEEEVRKAREAFPESREDLCTARKKLHTAREELRQARVEIFEEIARDFFRATDRNLRVRALVFSPFYHPIAALKLLSGGYSRADLIQAEYDRWFFRGNTLDQLPYVSAGDDSGSPGSLGPKLVINTTSLLTGERVAFSRESISGLQELSRVNANVLPLSRIVGASAGVPGLFPPTPVSGDLLVDGGVSDNQGLEGLWKEECDVLLVSDASGQMEQLHKLKSRAVAVLGRTNSIFQSGIRSQLIERLLQWRNQRPYLREFAFVHLHLNLKGDAEARSRVPSEYIAALARIRTDLDQFNYVEREALMFHGYTLIDSQLRRCCPRLIKSAVPAAAKSDPEARDGSASAERFKIPPLFANTERSASVSEGEDRKAGEATELKKRSEIKKILAAGQHAPLIMRSMARYGMKAGVVVALAWLLPVALFLGFGFGTLEAFLYSKLKPLSDLTPLSSWLDGLLPALIKNQLGLLADHLSWPITFRGVLAVTLFAASTYFLIFVTYSAIRWLSGRWDRRTYERLTGEDPELLATRARPSTDVTKGRIKPRGSSSLAE